MTFEEAVAAAVDALRIASWDAARDALARADELATSDAEHALVAIHRASIVVLQGRPEAEWQVFQENILRRHSARHVSLSAYYLVVSATDRGDRKTAERYLPILLDSSREYGDHGRILMSYDVAAAVESMRGNHIAAVEYGRVALDEARAYQGDDKALTLASVAHNLAYNCLAANEYRDAIDAIDIALEHADSTGNREVLRQVLITAAFAYLCREKLDEAFAFADRAEPLARGTRFERYVHYVRGEVARRRRDLVAAGEHFRKLEASYPEIPNVAEMLLSMNVAPFLMPE
jgi:tetratricopeptide (TPR) repeat protein